MRLVSCSKIANKPCMVIKVDEMCLVVDCGLDLRSVYSFLPSTLVGSTRLSSLPGYRSKDSSLCLSPCFRQSNGHLFIDGNPEVSYPDMSNVSIDQIDAVLLSNCQTMLALPFLTRQKDFRAAIYATDPTIQLGRFLSGELGQDPRNWAKLYTREEMESCLSRMNLIAFKETMDLHGILTITPYSSGYCIGSVNWLICTEYQKITYLSSSCAVTAHPKGMDMAPLKDADALIVTCLSEAQGSSPDSMVRQMCEAVAATLKSGGNVLFPCNPTGLLYDLLELVGNYMERAHGVPLDVPMYFVNPVSDSALAYANIFAEWLNDTKQANVYLPEEPFAHFQQMRNGKLKAYKAVYKRLSSEFKSPCVIFAGHPTLRFGDSVHFMELWRNEQKNTVILTDPDYPMADVLAPYQPLTMKAFYYPIDTRLNFDQLNLLLKDLRPKEVFYCEEYAKVQAAYPAHPEYAVKYPGATSFRFDEVKRVPFAAEYKKMRLDPSLADTVNLTEADGRAPACPLVGYLSAYDNNLELKPSTNTENKHAALLSPRLCGKLTASLLMSELKKNKIEATLEENSSMLDFAISFPGSGGGIRVSDGIKTSLNLGNSDEKFRISVKNCVVSCLSSI